MRTLNELIENNISREDMTMEEEILFVNYLYGSLEKEGFRDTYFNFFEMKETQSYDEKPFVVIKRVSEQEEDISFLPLWLIQFENGTAFHAYPEEIIKEYA